MEVQQSIVAFHLHLQMIRTSGQTKMMMMKMAKMMKGPGFWIFQLQVNLCTALGSST
jgi:hypothetical protein